MIGKAAARIENLRVELEGLHFDEARKLKSLLYKVGFLKANDLANVVHDLGLLKHYFLKTLLKLKAEEWATTVQEMIKGSGKSAFAFIRAEAVELRPFQNLLSRSDLRLCVTIGKPNGVRHGEADATTAWPCFDFLESLARKQVATLKPVSTVQIAETLKGSPNKKGGPDECTF